MSKKAAGHNDDCGHGFTLDQQHLCMDCKPRLFKSEFGLVDNETYAKKWAAWKERLAKNDSMDAGPLHYKNMSEDNSTAGLYACQHDSDIRTCLECAYIDGQILAETNPPAATFILGVSGIVTTVWTGGTCVAAWHTITGASIPPEAGQVYTIERAKELGIVNE